MLSNTANQTASGHAAWITRGAIAAAALLAVGSFWQIGAGSGYLPWSAARAAGAASSEAAAALRQTIAEAEATKLQAELALQLLDDVCRTRGRDRGNVQ
jgi:hypothetical protein